MRRVPDNSVCPGGGERPEQPPTAPAKIVATVRPTAREAMCRLRGMEMTIPPGTQSHIHRRHDHDLSSVISSGP